MRKLVFYNRAHLGDCLYQLHYCNKLAEFDINIEIDFYVNYNYFKELNTFIKYERVKIKDINYNLPKDAINTWITRDLNGINNYFFGRIGIHSNKYDLFYVDFFNELSNLIGVECPIKSNKDILLDNIELLENNIITNKYKEIDYLIINSLPLSGQFGAYNITHFNILINELIKQGKSVVTTRKINNDVLCTTDYNLSLMDIGNISTISKNIIGVMTSPIIPCFNIYNVDTFEKFYVLEDNKYYSFNDRIKHCNTITKIIEDIC